MHFYFTYELKNGIYNRDFINVAIKQLPLIGNIVPTNNGVFLN